MPEPTTVHSSEGLQEVADIPRLARLVFAYVARLRRGTLHVTPSAASEAEAARPSLARYIGALAEYKVYLAQESDTLEQAAQRLAGAIRSGDLARARALYPAAHQAYARVEPMAALFADLDSGPGGT